MAMVVASVNNPLQAQQPARGTPAMAASGLTEWRTNPDGVARMNLVGREPASPTEFVAFRERYPATFMADSTRITVHQHISTQHILVLRGTLILGLGNEVDYSKVKEYGPGSFIVIPSGAPHYEWNRGELEIQVEAIGR